MDPQAPLVLPDRRDPLVQGDLLGLLDLLVPMAKDRDQTNHLVQQQPILTPEQMLKVWTPYYQGEKYFTGEIPGMGLGLSMVAYLVWSAGGRCRAYNRAEGTGVTVELILGLAEGDGERSGATESATARTSPR